MSALGHLKKAARDYASKAREMERHRKDLTDKDAAREALAAYRAAEHTLLGAALQYDDEAGR